MTKKIVAIFISIICVLGIIKGNVYADDSFSAGDLSGSEESLYLNSLSNEIGTVGNKVITVVSTIGSVLSVIVIVILGIKYMLGSVEEKAAYKKTLVPFLVGAVFIFAASTIAGIIYNVVISLG